MAQSPKTSPKRSSKDSAKKRFTLEQANRALPLVRRIVTDVVAAHNQAVTLQNALTTLASGPDRSRKQDEFEHVVDRLQELSDELRLVGVELKDYASGLIDFVGRHKGKDVFLCWKLGEDKVAYFHDMTAGFAGRQSVDQLDEQE